MESKEAEMPTVDEVRAGKTFIYRGTEKPTGLPPGLTAVAHKRHPEQGYIEEWRIVAEDKEEAKSPKEPTGSSMFPNLDPEKMAKDFEERGQYAGSEQSQPRGDKED